MSKHPTPSQFARRQASFTPLRGTDYTPRQLELFPLDHDASPGIQTARTGLEEGPGGYDRRTEDEARPFNQARYNHGPRRYPD